MPNKVKHITVAVVIAAVGVTGTLWVRHRTTESAGGARRELVALIRALEHAVTAEDVTRTFDNSEHRMLTLERVSGQLWLVTTPYEFGAKNWYLYLDFERSVLVALRVRTEDSADVHPPDAPADVIRKR
jgi:hypothetical protein